MKHRFALGLALLCTLASSARADTSLVERLDQIVTKFMQQGGKPGISVAIQRGPRVIYSKGFGFADVELRVPVTPETVFPIGSITKTMTGLVVAQLVDAGKIDLDAPAGRYLPSLPTPARDALVRHLLNHTSGIVNYIELPEFPRNSERPVTRDEVVGWFASKPLMFPPGTRYNYTNSGAYLLGLIIEQVTGQPYDAYLETHVFQPFGMEHTSMADWRTLVDHRAKGYQKTKDGLQNAPRYDPLVAFSAGAVMSTTGDLLKYRAGVFDSPMTPHSVRERLHRLDRLTDGTLVPYSLGCLVHVELDGHRRIMHSGEIFGFSSQYAYYPDDEVTIVVLTNGESSGVPPVSLETKLARAVLGIPEPDRVQAPLPDSLGRKYAGEYTLGPITFGFDRMGFTYKDGRLIASFGGTDAGPALPLYYLGGGRFISSIDDEHTFQFDSTAPLRQVVMNFYGGEFIATAPAQPDR